MTDERAQPTPPPTPPLRWAAPAAGLVALAVAGAARWRRGRDRAARAAETRRSAELYARSAERLGSDQAAVRLAGVYALELLAQGSPDRPDLRQAVVNLLCGYLRMPCALPGGPPAADADDRARARYDDQVREREVRVTAQRVLCDHLRPGPDPDDPAATFWPDTDLDLTGATLLDLDLTDCRPRRVRFDRAAFTGRTRCLGTVFGGEAGFDGASFADHAVFYGAEFTRAARFGGTAFARHAGFEGARFAEYAGFDETVFGGPAGFRDAVFGADAWFGGATFAGNAVFDAAVFGGEVGFDGARFAGRARFADAVAAHPVPPDSSWPPGWGPVAEHGPVDGRDGTWHAVRADPRPAGTVGG